jgi:electron-transferring-flavoprotein dehydrogenase
MAREVMEFDVLIVGGGPAGLAAAIRIKQRAAESGRDIRVCLIDKGAEIGAHILSGAVMDPRALGELLPDWQECAPPFYTPVTEDRFILLTATGGWKVPGALLPACLHNRGNYIVSLAAVARWLGQQAEALGVEVYPGIVGAELSLGEQGPVTGVISGDMGVGRDGKPGPQYQPGMELRAKYTLFAEGCRGHLGRQLETRFNLRAGRDPQVYGLGLKEVWEIDPARHRHGLVMHSVGWPLDSATYGGSFLYHLRDNLVAIGFVVGLGYENPYLSPYEEFQRYKTHPLIRQCLEGGRRIAYGARAITAGGAQSLPELVFPGGALIGDEAGFLNASRIKGSHAAIKSGMLAADAVADALQAGRRGDVLADYPETYRESWLADELHQARNFKPLLSKFGLWIGSLLFGIDQTLLRGRAPWTLHHIDDHLKLKPAIACQPITYPKYDNKLSFDRPSSVFLSNTNHEEDQPCHLRLTDPSIPVSVNLATYAAPEQRYCPAGVYEIVSCEDGVPRLQINAQSCIHCKTCDIKDPRQNIVWSPPQGGEGPVYGNM